MAAFTSEEINEQGPIWDLFQNGGVVLFRRRDLLAEATKQLTLCGYRVHEVDCTAYQDEESILTGIVDALQIARYPRMGLDGFNDFVSQIDFEHSTGVIIVLVSFDKLQQAFFDLAFHILDILADNHRSHLLAGNRLLTIVQSDDPRLDEKLGAVGGYKPLWNSCEWYNKNRGL